METNVRQLIAAVCLMAASTAWSQDCRGPQRFVVGFAAGGGGDAIARLVAQQLTTRFGRPTVVENRTGANGNLAAEYVAKSPRDGCTILVNANAHNLNPLIYSRAGYQSKDFVGVHQGVAGPALLVGTTHLPQKSLAELLAYARSKPGTLAYATSGIGGPNHVAMELLLRAAKLEMVHVPYKGAAAAMADTVSGAVPLSMGSVGSSLPFVQAGKLVPLAVTGPKRWPTLPNTPSVAEAGYPSAVLVQWAGFFAPAGTPAPVVEKLNAEISTVLQEAEVKERLLVLGYEPEIGTVADFAKFLAEDEAASRRIVRDLQLKAE